MRILAIDPGNTESGVALIDSDTCSPIYVDKIDNGSLLQLIVRGSEKINADKVAIEMVASYGMAVGREVFDTCVWIGRFHEAVRGTWCTSPELVFRRDVKIHLCGQSRAKDPNVIQALVDRFAPGAPNRGKGTKAAPGWFHGFAKDMWQAYALAVTVADRVEGRQP